MLALIDCDIFLVSVAASCQKPYYSAYLDDILVGTWRGKTDLKKYLKEEGIDVKDCTIDKATRYYPFKLCIWNFRKLLRFVTERVGADDYLLLISSRTSWRKEKYPEYKSHRPDKPYYFEQLREWVLEEYKNVVSIAPCGLEADDVMGYSQYQTYLTHSPIICTLDKDLDGIPGWHFNWRKDKKYWVTEAQADLWFLTQLLIGDPADNIKGIPGVGIKAATEILNGLDGEKAKQAVREAYSSYFKEEASAELRKNADLLWILRESKGALYNGGDTYI